MSGLKLVSDFKDFYDHAFDRSGTEFRRVSTDGPKRRDMLELLNLSGFRTVRHGKVKDVAPKCDAVVVYFDETKHRGEGKGRFFSEDALLRFPDYYCSEFVKQPRVVSYRKLVVGNRVFELTYSSNDKWRSNVGEVEIEISGHKAISNEFTTLNYALYAVDYVWSGDMLAAVDLNVAPGMDGTGIERYMDAATIVRTIAAREAELRIKNAGTKFRRNGR
jgi:hypothetical protein